MSEDDELIQRMLKRCAFLQLAVREGEPALGVLVQARHLQDLLNEVIPLLEEDTTRWIQMRSIDKDTENALMDWLGNT